MAKALEYYFSDLTDLQKKAITLIHAYKAELEKEGLHVRSAIELEFMAEDAAGDPVAKRIDLDGLLFILQSTLPEGKHYIEKLGYEALGGLGIYNRLSPMVPEQYEINIADPSNNGKAEFHPELIAGITHHLKKQTLAEALKNTTALTQIHGKYPVLHPNFSVRPYRNNTNLAEKNVEKYTSYGELTSALHINVSLYDANNRNVFANDQALLYRCAKSLLDVQSEAALSMMPEKKSLWRIHANNSTPLGIGASIGHNLEDKCKNNQGKFPISVRIIRQYNQKGTPQALDKTRLENRLPGADADPFVSMAITMAALVDAVRTHKKEKTGDMAALQRDVETYAKAIPNPDDTPDAYDRLIDDFKRSERMKSLLGGEFYNAILKEYAGHSLAV